MSKGGQVVQIRIDCTKLQAQLLEFTPQFAELALEFGSHQILEGFGDFIRILPCEGVAAIVTDAAGNAVNTIAAASFYHGQSGQTLDSRTDGINEWRALCETKKHYICRTRSA